MVLPAPPPPPPPHPSIWNDVLFVAWIALTPPPLLFFGTPVTRLTAPVRWTVWISGNVSRATASEGRVQGTRRRPLALSCCTTGTRTSCRPWKDCETDLLFEALVCLSVSRSAYCTAAVYFTLQPYDSSMSGGLRCPQFMIPEIARDTVHGPMRRSYDCRRLLQLEAAIQRELWVVCACQRSFQGVLDLWMSNIHCVFSASQFVVKPHFAGLDCLRWHDMHSNEVRTVSYRFVYEDVPKPERHSSQLHTHLHRLPRHRYSITLLYVHKRHTAVASRCSRSNIAKTFQEANIKATPIESNLIVRVPWGVSTEHTHFSHTIGKKTWNSVKELSDRGTGSYS